MNQMKKCGLSILCAFLLFFPLIPNSDSANAQTNPPDYWPTTDWQTATPESQGMTSWWLHQMEVYLQQVSWAFALRSILIVRHGYLVYENYQGIPDRVNDTNNIYSCTKSVTSCLIGIATSQGYLDINDHVVDFFSDLTIDNLDSRKQAITIAHLLSMTSGLPWDEWSYPYGNPNNDWDQMTSSSNWVQFVLDRPMDYTPGTHWIYNTGGSHLLSAILARATNISTLTFAETNLFSPLGIQNF
ncbi:MAG: serine hydrolase domain-containing protein, partial [Candidatus Thorarchaeota archaeon]